MYRTALICATILVATIYGWELRAPVPFDFYVNAHSVITHPADKRCYIPDSLYTVWGIFHYEYDEDTTIPDRDTATALLYYSSSGDSWCVVDTFFAEIMERTAMTFQWIESPVLWIVCSERSPNESERENLLYSYNLIEEVQDWEDIDSFNVRPRPGLAFRPNPQYNQQLQPIPGWLYCLPGGSNRFWRYWIPSSKPVAVNGIYPPQGSLIADQTPIFIWQDEPSAIQYRLVVSTDPEFLNMVIDVTTARPRYQVDTKMANGIYYWKTAYQSSHRKWVWSPVHGFQLQGGWERLPDIPDTVRDGSALAYVKNLFGLDERLVALVGGGSTRNYIFDPRANRWEGWHSTYSAQNPGTSLTAHRWQTSCDHPCFAIFGVESDSVRFPHIHFEWYGFRELPEPLGPGASIAMSGLDTLTRTAYLYLLSGSGLNNFWRLPISVYEGEKISNSSGSQGEPGQNAVNVRFHPVSNGIAIDYELNSPVRVKVKVYDATGRLVKNIYSGYQGSGFHRLIWNPGVSGVYFLLLDTGDNQVKLKVVIR